MRLLIGHSSTSLHLPILTRQIPSQLNLAFIVTCQTAFLSFPRSYWRCCTTVISRSPDSPLSTLTIPPGYNPLLENLHCSTTYLIDDQRNNRYCVPLDGTQRPIPSYLHKHSTELSVIHHHAKESNPYNLYGTEAHAPVRRIVWPDDPPSRNLLKVSSMGEPETCISRSLGQVIALYLTQGTHELRSDTLF